MSLALQVVDDPAGVCAELLDEVAGAGGHIVLAGGNTPRAAYERAGASDWASATVWFGDERCVPPDDSRSNYGMARDALLSRVQPTVHRIPAELGPGEGADAYEQELRDAGPPRFDLVLLGIGPDGHTASLFPGQASLDERDRLMVGIEQAGLEPFVPRVSLTLPGLALGKRIVFLIEGSAKAEAVANAFGPSATPNRDVPSSLVPTFASEVTVLLDPTAADKVSA